jgi:hypothetical protein
MDFALDALLNVMLGMNYLTSDRDSILGAIAETEGCRMLANLILINKNMRIFRTFMGKISSICIATVKKNMILRALA